MDLLGVKSKAITTLAVVLLIAATCALAGDTPNHLEPIKPHAYTQFLNEYYELVFTKLVGDCSPSIWMIVEPSFSPEYALILRKVLSDDSTESYFQLEYSAVNEPIWNYDKNEDGTLELSPKRDAIVERKTARLDQKIARDVIDTWEIVLKQTRYAEKEWIGLDGVTYKFFAHPEFFGQTWSPESGTPKMMVECGELLIRFVTSDLADQRDLLGRISELTAKLREKTRFHE